MIPGETGVDTLLGRTQGGFEFAGVVLSRLDGPSRNSARRLAFDVE
jgi:hypothetical protein